MAEENKKNTAKIDQSKQNKLKNQTNTQSQDEKLKAKPASELRKLLTNKNSDYVFRLQKELEKQGNMSAEDAHAKVDEMLPEIIVAQRHGQPANGLYMASPKIKANEIIHPHQKPKTMFDFPFWQRAVDSVTLWVAIFFGFYGILALFNTKNVQSQNGVLTIISTGILFGIFITKSNEWSIPRYDENGRRQKPNWFKIILSSVLAIVGLMLWLALVSLPALRVINPTLPPVVYLILAAACYGGHYLFRKHYGITGSAFAPNPRNK